MDSDMSEVSKADLIEKTLLELSMHEIYPKGIITLSVDSHNITVTDNSSFFIKIMGSSNNITSFKMEMLAAQVIPNTPQLLLNDMITIASHPATVWKYINGATPSLENLTEENIRSTVRQINIIHKTNPSRLPLIRDLSQVLSTVNRRLGSEKALSMPQSLQNDLRRLVDTFVEPISQRGSQGAVVCHSDVHIGNIMIHPDGSLQVIDYESLKLAPAELDLACFYHDMVQLNNRSDLYQLAEDEFKVQNSLDEELLRKVILMKNVSTTTYTIAFGNWSVVADRVSALTRSLKTGEPPETLRAMT
jgi:thiamine kinase-like enzyme